MQPFDCVLTPGSVYFYSMIAGESDYRMRRAIQETLKARGMSQREAARRAGISHSRLNQFLAGKRDMLGRHVDAVRFVLGLVIYDPLTCEDDG